MKDTDKTKEQLLRELKIVRKKVDELSAIISDNRKIEDELRRSKEEYRLIFELAPDGIITVNTLGVVTSCNKAFEELTGYSNDEIIGKHFSKMPTIRKKDISSFFRLFTSFIKGEKIKAFVFPWIDKDGIQHVGEAHGAAIKIGNRYVGAQAILRDVTESTKMKEVLQESEERYRNLYESSPLGITVLDLKGKILSCNEAVYWNSGFTEADLIGKHFTKIGPLRAQDIPTYVKLFATIIKGKVPWPLEVEYNRKDGTTGWTEVYIAPITVDKRLTGIQVLQNDITERKQREEQHRTILKTALDGFWIVNLQGRFVEVNDSYCEMIGYTKEELLTMSISDVEAIESHDETTKHIKKIMEQGYDRFESRHRRRDGRIIDVEVSVNYLDVGEGRMFVFLRDITDRKRAEEVLSEEATRRRILVDGSRDGIVVLNQDGKVYESNRRFAEMLGYSLNEVSQLQVYDWEFQFPRKQVLEMIRTVDKTGDHFETKHRRKDGTVYDVEISTNAATFAGQKLIFCVCRDITERKQSEQKIEELYQKEKELRQGLEDEMNRRIDFTRALIHELKTPLTPILAACELLVDGAEEGTLLRLARNIQRSANKLNNRVGTLLDLAKGELGTLEKDTKKFDPLQLLSRIVEEMTPATKSDGLKLILDVPMSLPLIWADENQIEQVVTNLLTNAFKWSSKGNKVIMRALEKDGLLLMQVEDNGPGIPEGKQNAIFDPYYRIEGDRQHLSGLGLGLALCKKIVESHGGQIWVESNEGKGSTFNVELPIVAANDEVKV